MTVSGVRAEQLEEAMYEVIEDLKANPVSARELQKVKDQLRLRKIRFVDMMSGKGILFLLGQNAALGDWTETNNSICPSRSSVGVALVRPKPEVRSLRTPKSGWIFPSAPSSTWSKGE